MFYASVTVTQIQSYLARSRRLWGRRGASEMLYCLTSTERQKPGERWAPIGVRLVRELLEDHPRVVLNDEAVDIDGAIHIQGDSRDAVECAAHALALNIQVNLPAIPVTTQLFQADSYTRLLGAGKRKDCVAERTYPPVLVEFPLGQHCDECSSGIAAGISKFDDDGRTDHRLCPDCLSRLQGRRNTVLDPSPGRMMGFLAEWDLINALSRAGHPLAQVADFNQLAALGRLAAADARRTHTGNHLATIFADGNGFGALFENAMDEAQQECDTRAIRRLSKAVKEATKRGLIKATEKILRPPDTAMPAIPHIVSGDDILVTVPATRAWPFLRAFLISMRQAFKEDDELKKAGVSFSAGMVFCQSKYPFGDQVELAERLLKKAKQEVNGDDWSVAWLDVTSEGHDIPDRVYTLDQLEALDILITAAEQLGAASSRGNAARNNLREVLLIPDDAERTKHLLHLAPRLEGADNLLRRAFGHNWAGEHAEVTKAQAADLLAVLSILRWQS